MYGNSSHLIFASESNPVVLQSQQGVHQGDPLGPALFATGIQDILVNTQVDHVDVTFLAYLDDVFIFGPPTKCLDAFNDFKSALKSAELSIYVIGNVRPILLLSLVYYRTSTWRDRRQ